MNALAQRYTPQGVGSIFLYTHEAYPGEFYPHHNSMAQKLRHARELRDRLGVMRPILVNAQDGACHRAVWVDAEHELDLRCVRDPQCKSDWTDPASIANAVEYFLDVLPRRKAGERLAPFHVERLDLRHQDREGFYAALERNGPKAAQEYRAAFG